MKSRTFIAVLCLFPLASLVSAESISVYIGTMGMFNPEGGGRGIYRAVLDTDTGTLSAPTLAVEANSPAFLDIHPNGNFLYAVCGGGAMNDNGTVNAFAIDRSTGNLTLVNQQTSGGTMPLQMSIDREGRNVLVANYGSGGIEVVPIAADGSLGKPTSFIQHEGSSVNPQRQAGPHAHCIFASPDNHYVYVPDLGLDKIMIYRFDSARGTLTPNNPASVSTAQGAGPRHFTFHPNGRFLYLMTEMTGTVNCYNYDSSTGALTEFQTISALPEGYDAAVSCAEVRVHPNGRFLYTSNRGNSTITVYRIDPATGRLTLVEFETAGMESPWNINIDPTGTFCLAPNMNGGTVTVFRINQETGVLDMAGSPVPVPSPICIKFLR